MNGCSFEAMATWSPPVGLFGNVNDIGMVNDLRPDVGCPALEHTNHVEIRKTVEFRAVSHPAWILEVGKKVLRNFRKDLF